MERGKLIVIEGIDGSGKGTQAKELCKYLDSVQKKNILFSFPQYSTSFFGKEVGNFLNGDFGTLSQVHPKLASLLYAGDRFEGKNEIEKHLSAGTWVICDRYVGSNAAHNSSKLPKEQRAEFVNWIFEMEFKVFNIPQPDCNILLDLPFDLSEKMVAKKDARDYTTKTHDIHEADKNYLRETAQVYKNIALEYNWKIIDVADDNGVKSIEAISKSVADVVNQL